MQQYARCSLRIGFGMWKGVLVVMEMLSETFLLPFVFTWCPKIFSKIYKKLNGRRFLKSLTIAILDKETATEHLRMQ